MGKAKAKPNEVEIVTVDADGNAHHRNEVLLVKGRWSIERSWERPSEGTVRPSWWHDNTKSFIKHRCTGDWWVVPTVFGWPDTDDGEVCWRCEEPIPDGIKGTWMLHNWEALQREAR